MQMEKLDVWVKEGQPKLKKIALYTADFLWYSARIPLCRWAFPMIRWRLRGSRIWKWQISLGRYMQPFYWWIICAHCRRVHRRACFPMGYMTLSVYGVASLLNLRQNDAVLLAG